MCDPSPAFNGNDQVAETGEQVGEIAKLFTLVSPMKKLVAATLLLIFLFNVGGYSVLYWMANRQASIELKAKLDRNEFSGSQAITIKVPISLPYQPDRDYERVDGEFEYEGQFYKLVKQRVLGDTLYVVCIIDTQKKKLVDEMDDFTRKANESSSAHHPLKIVNSSPIQVYSNSSVVGLISFSSGWTLSLGVFETNLSFIEPSVGTASPPPWC